MSIVNDALKKAGKEFGFDGQNASMENGQSRPAEEETRHIHLLSGHDKKRPKIAPLVFVVIAILMAAFFLHKSISGTNADYIAGESDKSGAAIQSTLNNIEQKDTVKALKSQNIAKLNGIVYDNAGKWAIVNDKIVKEGDSLLGGEIISIARDLVKIKKEDGTEIVLNLK